MMNKEDIFVYIIIGFVFAICLKVYTESEMWKLKCIVSTVDGMKYCVRERHHTQKAVDLLANAVSRCKTLIEHLLSKYPENNDVKRLADNFDPRKVSETLPTSELTAYSENKGEKMAFCLNVSKLNNNVLIDINTLTFVAIHELSHLMTESIGHKQEFWVNFKFLLKEATKINIYNAVNYKKDPVDYCGIQIRDSPLYDL